MVAAPSVSDFSFYTSKFSAAQRGGLLLHALRLRRVLVAMAAVVLALVPLDFAFGLFDHLYPVDVPPKTHPVTFSCLLLGLVASAIHPAFGRSSLAEVILWCAVLFGVALQPFMALWLSDAFPQAMLGAMGSNTATSLALLAVGHLLRAHSYHVGFYLICAALFLPMVALNGMLIGNHDFFGEMSLTTALSLVGIAGGSVVGYVRHRSIRLVVLDTLPGRLLRRHIALWLSLAIIVPVSLRLVGMGDSYGFSFIYTAQMTILLIGILYFGLRYSGMLEQSRMLERQLLRDVETDDLTGAASRKAAYSFFKAQAWRGPMAVILIDLDHFKEVNDTYGHAIGDEALIRCSRILRKGLRLRDMVVRWGGEEFLVLMPVVTGVDVEARAQELREAIMESSKCQDKIPSFTASFGVALALPSGRADLDRWVAQADRALYAAKEQGRNRVVFAKTAVAFHGPPRAV